MLDAEEAAKQNKEAERRAKERTGTVMSIYSARIRDAIKNAWRVDPGTERWREAIVNIKLTPRGEVESVRIVKSSGLPAFDKSVETAVYKASPLPFPTAEEDASANEKLQNINLTIDLKN